MYPGVCYECKKIIPTGFGHYEKHNGRWRIHCVKCTSGRIVKETDSEVIRAVKLREEREKIKCSKERN